MASQVKHSKRMVNQQKNKPKRYKLNQQYAKSIQIPK